MNDNNKHGYNVTFSGSDDNRFMKFEPIIEMPYPVEFENLDKHCTSIEINYRNNLIELDHISRCNYSQCYSDIEFITRGCPLPKQQVSEKPEDKWHNRFLDMAELVSSWSKDPSTKCGAIIVDKNRKIVSTGYNGFPQGMSDSKEDYTNKEIKNSKVIHAEINAICFAKRDLTGCTLYISPMLCCDRCAVQVIQSGIKNVVYRTTKPDRAYHKMSREYFKESGVSVKCL